jgi:hypothetical protein
MRRRQNRRLVVLNLVAFLTVVACATTPGDLKANRKNGQPTIDPITRLSLESEKAIAKKYYEFGRKEIVNVSLIFNGTSCTDEPLLNNFTAAAFKNHLLKSPQFALVTLQGEVPDCVMYGQLTECRQNLVAAAVKVIDYKTEAELFSMSTIIDKSEIHNSAEFISWSTKLGTNPTNGSTVEQESDPREMIRKKKQMEEEKSYLVAKVVVFGHSEQSQKPKRSSSDRENSSTNRENSFSSRGNSESNEYEEYESYTTSDDGKGSRTTYYRSGDSEIETVYEYDYSDTGRRMTVTRREKELIQTSIPSEIQLAINGLIYEMNIETDSLYDNPIPPGSYQCVASYKLTLFEEQSGGAGRHVRKTFKRPFTLEVNKTEHIALTLICGYDGETPSLDIKLTRQPLRKKPNQLSVPGSSPTNNVGSAKIGSGSTGAAESDAAPNVVVSNPSRSKDTDLTAALTVIAVVNGDTPVDVGVTESKPVSNLNIDRKYPAQLSFTFNGKEYSPNTKSVFFNERVPPGIYECTASFWEAIYNGYEQTQKLVRERKKKFSLTVKSGELTTVTITFVYDGGKTKTDILLKAEVSSLASGGSGVKQ